MKRDLPKQYLLLQKRPVLTYVLKAFDTCEAIRRIVLVVPEQDIPYCRKVITPGIAKSKPIQIVAGGNAEPELLARGQWVHDEVGLDVRVGTSEEDVGTPLHSQLIMKAGAHQDVVEAVVVDIADPVDGDTELVSQRFAVESEVGGGVQRGAA